MAELQIISTSGKAAGKHQLHEAIAQSDVSKAVMHRAVVSEEANSRQGTQSTKSRSEAKGGGRKPYKQKKTGNARQGTIRAPHYAHGGMALAVKPRDYSKKVNKKERRLAIIGAFAAKAEAGDIMIADAIAFGVPKTKDAVAMLQALGVANVRRVLIVTSEHNDAVVKSFRNLSNVEVRCAPNRDGKGEPFSTRDILVAHKIVIAKDAMAKIEEAWTK
jgi:large subunit ribosomal protein L4